MEDKVQSMCKWGEGWLKAPRNCVIGRGRNVAAVWDKASDQYMLYE